jgi:hypothetical protein
MFVFAFFGAICILGYCVQALVVLQSRSPQIGVWMLVALLVSIVLASLVVIWMRRAVRPGEYGPPLAIHVLGAVGALGVAILGGIMYFGAIWARSM